MIQKTINALINAGYDARFFETAKEAKAAVLGLIGSEGVGFGGSLTIDSMGIYEALKEKGNDVSWHWKGDENANARSALAPFFLSSTNALTTSGKLLNIDGRGNRVAGMITAANLIIVAGKNKIVDGSDNVAIARIKKCCCGQNAKRLGIPTPCAETFECSNCDHPRRICRATTILERPMMGQKAYIFIVNEDMGL